MAKKQIDLGLTGLDELFMDDQERAESKLPKIHEIPLSEIDEFPNHPFHVRLDEDMDQLVESIKERGIITPVTLRQKPDGRYEIVSGHRRTKACELAGLATVKAEIKELSRDEAIILMVESNLQRTTILPSEKAFSYKMRLEAMNRQGQRTDLTCGPVGHKLDGTKSRDIIADSTKESARQVSRYTLLKDYAFVGTLPADNTEMELRVVNGEAFEKLFKISMQGTLTYKVGLGTDVFGNIQRMDNLLESMPTRQLDYKEKLKNLEIQVENAKQEVAKPFPREEELKTKSARLDQLNILLNMDKRENEIVDGATDEGEIQPQRESRGWDR